MVSEGGNFCEKSQRNFGKIPPRPSVEVVWTWLADVPDPEIPVVSVVDMGIGLAMLRTALGSPAAQS